MKFFKKENKLYPHQSSLMIPALSIKEFMKSIMNNAAILKANQRSSYMVDPVEVPGAFLEDFSILRNIESFFSIREDAGKVNHILALKIIQLGIS